MEAMTEFLADYEAGRLQGRYLDAELPHLPFAAESFDLAQIKAINQAIGCLFRTTDPPQSRDALPRRRRLRLENQNS